MFGFSLSEMIVICLVTLVAVGPQKLPGMLKTMGQWARKLRKMTMDVRQQTGIDEMLRAEGIQLSELRTLMRGYHGGAAAPVPAAPVPAAPAPARPYDDPYGDIEPDPSREYPLEGADAYGALPDDLLSPPEPAPAPELAESPPTTTTPEPLAAGAEPPAVPEQVAPAAAEAAPAAEPAAVPVAAPAPVTAPAALAASAPATVSSPPRPAASVPPAMRPTPPPPPVRTVPPPAPSSRPFAARPSGAPPPPPRRSAMPPRPEPSSPVNNPSEPGVDQPAGTVTGGTANGSS
ncbi:MAG TPA: hypothetical protein VIW29_04365 [Polyangiaceae bacterium]